MKEGKDVRLAGRAPGGGEVEGDGLLAALDLTQGDGVSLGVDERGAEQVGQRLGRVGEVGPAWVARDAVAALGGQQLKEGERGEGRLCKGGLGWGMMGRMGAGNHEDDEH